MIQRQQKKTSNIFVPSHGAVGPYALCLILMIRVIILPFFLYLTPHLTSISIRRAIKRAFFIL